MPKPQPKWTAAPLAATTAPSSAALIATAKSSVVGGSLVARRARLGRLEGLGGEDCLGGVETSSEEDWFDALHRWVEGASAAHGSAGRGRRPASDGAGAQSGTDLVGLDGGSSRASSVLRRRTHAAKRASARRKRGGPTATSSSRYHRFVHAVALGPSQGTPWADQPHWPEMEAFVSSDEASSDSSSGDSDRSSRIAAPRRRAREAAHRVSASRRSAREALARFRLSAQERALSGRQDSADSGGQPSSRGPSAGKLRGASGSPEGVKDPSFAARRRSEASSASHSSGVSSASPAQPAGSGSGTGSDGSDGQGPLPAGAASSPAEAPFSSDEDEALHADWQPGTSRYLCSTFPCVMLQRAAVGPWMQPPRVPAGQGGTGPSVLAASGLQSVASSRLTPPGPTAAGSSRSGRRAPDGDASSGWPVQESDEEGSAGEEGGDSEDGGAGRRPGPSKPEAVAVGLPRDGDTLVLLPPPPLTAAAGLSAARGLNAAASGLADSGECSSVRRPVAILLSRVVPAGQAGVLQESASALLDADDDLQHEALMRAVAYADSGSAASRSEHRAMSSAASNSLRQLMNHHRAMARVVAAMPNGHAWSAAATQAEARVERAIEGAAELDSPPGVRWTVILDQASLLDGRAADAFAAEVRAAGPMVEAIAIVSRPHGDPGTATGRPSRSGSAAAGAPNMRSESRSSVESADRDAQRLRRKHSVGGGSDHGGSVHETRPGMERGSRIPDVEGPLEEPWRPGAKRRWWARPLVPCLSESPPLPLGRPREHAGGASGTVDLLQKMLPSLRWACVRSALRPDELPALMDWVALTWSQASRARAVLEPAAMRQRGRLLLGAAAAAAIESGLVDPERLDSRPAIAVSAASWMAPLPCGNGLLGLALQRIGLQAEDVRPLCDALAGQGSWAEVRRGARSVRQASCSLAESPIRASAVGCLAGQVSAATSGRWAPPPVEFGLGDPFALESPGPPHRRRTASLGDKGAPSAPPRAPEERQYSVSFDEFVGELSADDVPLAAAAGGSAAAGDDSLLVDGWEMLGPRHSRADLVRRHMAGVRIPAQAVLPVESRGWEVLSLECAVELGSELPEALLRTAAASSLLAAAMAEEGEATGGRDPATCPSDVQMTAEALQSAVASVAGALKPVSLQATLPHAAVLRGDCGLRWLDLSGNSLGDAGVAAVLSAAAKSRVLLGLDLSRNGVGQAGHRTCEAITRRGGLLDANASLRQLRLGSNGLGDAAVALIVVALCEARPAAPASAWEGAASCLARVRRAAPQGRPTDPRLPAAGPSAGRARRAAPRKGGRESPQAPLVPSTRLAVLDLRNNGIGSGAPSTSVAGSAPSAAQPSSARSAAVVARIQAFARDATSSFGYSAPGLSAAERALLRLLGSKGGGTLRELCLQGNCLGGEFGLRAADALRARAAASRATRLWFLRLAGNSAVAPRDRRRIASVLRHAREAWVLHRANALGLSSRELDAWTGTAAVREPAGRPDEASAESQRVSSAAPSAGTPTPPSTADASAAKKDDAAAPGSQPAAQVDAGSRGEPAAEGDTARPQSAARRTGVRFEVAVEAHSPSPFSSQLPHPADRGGPTAVMSSELEPSGQAQVLPAHSRDASMPELIARGSTDDDLDREDQEPATVVVLGATPLACPVMVPDGGVGLSALEPIAVEQERAAVWTAMAAVHAHVEFDIGFASWDALQTTLSGAAAVRVLHLMAHGSDPGQPALLGLEQADGRAVIKGVHHLKETLKAVCLARPDGRIPVGLAFVNSCNSEEIGEALVEAGVPHVIAVRRGSKVADEAGPPFVNMLYKHLADGANVSTAFALARRCVATMPSLPQAAREEQQHVFTLLPRMEESYRFERIKDRLIERLHERGHAAANDTNYWMFNGCCAAPQHHDRPIFAPPARRSRGAWPAQAKLPLVRKLSAELRIGPDLPALASPRGAAVASRAARLPATFDPGHEGGSEGSGASSDGCCSMDPPPAASLGPVGSAASLVPSATSAEQTDDAAGAVIPGLAGALVRGAPFPHRLLVVPAGVFEDFGRDFSSRRGRLPPVIADGFPFCGRRVQTCNLLSRLLGTERVTSGTARSATGSTRVAITGAAGVGKSSLLRFACEHLALRRSFGAFSGGVFFAQLEACDTALAAAMRIAEALFGDVRTAELLAAYRRNRESEAWRPAMQRAVLAASPSHGKGGRAEADQKHDPATREPGRSLEPTDTVVQRRGLRGRSTTLPDPVPATGRAEGASRGRSPDLLSADRVGSLRDEAGIPSRGRSRVSKGALAHSRFAGSSPSRSRSRATDARARREAADSETASALAVAFALVLQPLHCLLALDNTDLVPRELLQGLERELNTAGARNVAIIISCRTLTPAAREPAPTDTSLVGDSRLHAEGPWRDNEFELGNLSTFDSNQLLRSRLGADSTLSASGLMTMFQSSMGNPRSMVRAAAAFRDSKMRQQRMREEEEASFAFAAARHAAGSPDRWRMQPIFRPTASPADPAARRGDSGRPRGASPSRGSAGPDSARSGSQTNPFAAAFALERTVAKTLRRTARESPPAAAQRDADHVSGSRGPASGPASATAAGAISRSVSTNDASTRLPLGFRTWH